MLHLESTHPRKRTRLPAPFVQTIVTGHSDRCFGDYERGLMSRQGRYARGALSTVPGCVCPQNIAAMESFLQQGRVPDAWSLSLFNCIPNISMVVKAKDQRPIALQNAAMKWLSTVMLIRLQDIFAQIIPPSQKGFMPGRQMLDHILHACTE